MVHHVAAVVCSGRIVKCKSNVSMCAVVPAHMLQEGVAAIVKPVELAARQNIKDNCCFTRHLICVREYAGQHD